jgi:hypothetical protein
MTRGAKRRAWLAAVVVFAALALFWWVVLARSGLASGAGLLAVTASVAAVFSFLAWSQVPPESP